MKTVLLTICFSVFVVAGGGLAEKKQEPAGKVYGHVFNASKSSATGEKIGLAGREVVLYRYIDGKSTDGARPHTVTDASGRFEFGGLDAGKRYAYYPVSVEAGIEYYGRLVTLTADSLQKRSDVPLFEATSSDSSISVAMAHIVITPGPGVLNVKEVNVFTNHGRHTFVGNAPAGPSGKKIVLSIDVPDKAQDVQFGGDLMACCAVVTDDYIYDTMEFKPGGRQEVVSYVVPYDGEDASITKQILHPTGTVDVFLPQGAGTLRAQGFTAQGSFAIRGKSYGRYSAAKMARGTVMTLALVDLPAAPQDWRWLAPVALVTVVLLAGAIYRWRSKSRQGAGKTDEEAPEPEPVDPNRQRLMDEILQLDEAYGAGRIAEDTYLAATEKLKELVLAMDEKQTEQFSGTIEQEA